MILFIRTCQSCGHRQRDTEPREQGVMTDAYRERQCKHCKSRDLDYGSQQDVDPVTLEHLPYEED